MNYKNSSYEDHEHQGAHKRASDSAKSIERFDYVHYCYSIEAVQNLDYLMVEQGVVDSSYQLMTRAAQALLDFIYRKYSRISHITIICGAGNNAGDGYVLARLAKLQEKEACLKVRLISIIDPKTLLGDAHKAYNDWLDCGGEVDLFDSDPFPATDLIIDALLGTGLNRALENQWYKAVAAINASNYPVLSVDIPSGLNADTGEVLGIAVRADNTMTFIAQKIGMYTAQARQYCGKISFASLGVEDSLYQQIEHSAILMEWTDLSRKLPCRSPVSQKDDHGHLLIIGGDYGMAGACRIAGEAALRSGAGLVSIATRKENVAAITSSRPELMVHGIENADELDPLIERASAIAIGPGLGTEKWGMALLEKIIKLLKYQSDSDEHPRHCVIDADALNLIAKHNMIVQNEEIIYTPHFKEACRLLKHDEECPTETTDRFTMIRSLKKKYYGAFVLKGAGTLINLDDDIAICPYGNGGMASAGMGDCLTGIIGALLAQQIPVLDAAQIGVCLHAKAGDMVANEGKNGMIVSDLFPKIRQLMNDK